MQIEIIDIKSKKNDKDQCLVFIKGETIEKKCLSMVLLDQKIIKDLRCVYSKTRFYNVKIVKRMFQEKLIFQIIDLEPILDKKINKTEEIEETEEIEDELEEEMIGIMRCIPGFDFEIKLESPYFIGYQLLDDYLKSVNPCYPIKETKFF